MAIKKDKKSTSTETTSTHPEDSPISSLRTPTKYAIEREENIESSAVSSVRAPTKYARERDEALNIDLSPVGNQRAATTKYAREKEEVENANQLVRERERAQKNRRDYIFALEEIVQTSAELAARYYPEASPETRTQLASTLLKTFGPSWIDRELELVRVLRQIDENEA